VAKSFLNQYKELFAKNFYFIGKFTAADNVEKRESDHILEKLSQSEYSVCACPSLTFFHN
tara:strand:+ start:1605 stop:1784 length:180 start_codon:yes stop_codon:yes gene_type:complete